MIRLGILAKRCLERIEDDAISAIADRVDVDLESALQRGFCPRLDVAWLRHEQSGIRRLVAVGSEQRSSTRAECAIGVQLQRSNPEMIVVKRALRAALDRKSTRLNSSHVEISYAVFCL